MSDDEGRKVVARIHAEADPAASKLSRGISRGSVFAIALIACAATAVGVGEAQHAYDNAHQAQVAQSQAKAAQSQAKQVANPVLALCKGAGAVAKALESAGACAGAQQVQSSPVVSPSTAVLQRVQSVSVQNGDLIVVYSSGQSANLGRVAGQAGGTGSSGTNGTNGATGSPGPAGVSITGTSLANGVLSVTYSNGTTTTVGQVVGPPGIAGAAGVSVTSVTINSQDHLIVTFSNGTTADAGQLPAGATGPAGPAGKDAPSITSIQCSGGDGGETFTFELSDGSTDVASCPTATATPSTSASPSPTTTP